MPKIPGVIPSAAAGIPYHSAKPKNNQKNEKNEKKNGKFEKFQQNSKNNVKKIIIPAFNRQEFTEVSIMHLLDNYILKALKKACYGGSDTKIECSWTQFSSNINAAIDYVALKIYNEYTSTDMIQEQKLHTSLELYQTVTLEEGAQIITIPKPKNVNIKNVVKAVNNSFTKNKIIYDFNKFVLALTYSGCKSVCSFCKQQKNWKSDCPGLKKFKQINKKNNKKNIKSAPKINQNIVGLAPKTQKQPTSQEQLAENSNRLGELQKIVTEQKSDYKNSKEKAGQCIVSNTHKKPVEISLELSDQAIVSESSCPSTPNFKKEWDKSDDNYTENNFSVAVIDMDLFNKLADNNDFNDAEMQ
ncbi:hypothetical protein BB561_006280 [Smittium simulii]|uniref:Uncharacterized protein n=1 Tax=Smittium simulii TaxID=133385 RepID=A0A2T9Y5G0_9FUNG|nr:hypothetical protein BB561_006280 [Smittium simulii]